MMTNSLPGSQDRKSALAFSSKTLERIEYVMLFLLLLSFSSSYRIWAGSNSISLSAFGTLVFLLWRWSTVARADSDPGTTARWLARGFWTIAAWAGVLWLLSLNWHERSEMVANWVLAALLFPALLQSPIRDAKRLALVFLLAAIPNVVLGLAQHVSGIGLSPKDFAGWNRNAAFFPIYGFFGHSNDLAVFLYWPFVLAVGLFFSQKGWLRLAYILAAALTGLALYWTISRSTVLTLLGVAIIWSLLHFLPRRKWFLTTGAAGLGGIVLFLVWLVLSQTPEQINIYLSGRLSLWQSTWNAIAADVLYLPLGYLNQAPAQLSIFYIPHNMYLLSWIEFGWLGVLLLAGMSVFLFIGGLRRYADLHRDSFASCLWAGLIGLLFVNAMVILYLHETYVILYFVGIAALWVRQLREIDSPASLPQTGIPVQPDLPSPDKPEPARPPIGKKGRRAKTAGKGPASFRAPNGPAPHVPLPSLTRRVGMAPPQPIEG